MEETKTKTLKDIIKKVELEIADDLQKIKDYNNRILRLKSIIVESKEKIKYNNKVLKFLNSLLDKEKKDE